MFELALDVMFMILLLLQRTFEVYRYLEVQQILLQPFHPLAPRERERTEYHIRVKAPLAHRYQPESKSVSVAFGNNQQTTLANDIFPLFSSIIFSILGVSNLQGPHHVAKKSTITGCLLLRTLSSKSFSF